MGGGAPSGLIRLYSDLPKKATTIEENKRVSFGMVGLVLILALIRGFPVSVVE
jgi:hypothetical protein